MRKIYFILCLIFCVTWSCNPAAKDTSKKKTKLQANVDTVNSFRIDSFWVTPKRLMKYGAIQESGADTLDLVMCGDYMFSPFGVIDIKSDLKTSKLFKFIITDTTAADGGGNSLKIQKLKFKSSKLILLFPDPGDNSDRSSHIVKGEIYDKDVQFINGVMIGMKIKDFYRKFFEHFPIELMNDYKVIVFDSCVEDLKHVYTFNNGELMSVKFYGNYVIKVDY